MALDSLTQGKEKSKFPHKLQCKEVISLLKLHTLCQEKQYLSKFATLLLHNQFINHTLKTHAQQHSLQTQRNEAMNEVGTSQQRKLEY